MDISRFGEFKTGRLSPIKVNETHDDWAFIPNQLPPSWSMSHSIWPLLVEARARVAQLESAGNFLKNPALLLRPLQRREAIKSNTIEGTFVTPQEMLLFEANERGADDSKRNDWQEVVYYDAVLARGFNLISEGKQIDRDLIKTLHEHLLLGERGKDKQPGKFRTTQVYVSAGGRYIPPPPESLEECLSAFETFVATNNDLDPLIRSFIAHYQFEAIHPFIDGNGRLGRILLSLMICKWLKHSHAWLYMSEFFDKHRRDYVEKLFEVSASGQWDEWVTFCLLGTIEQAESALKICRALNELKDRYEKLVGHAPRLHAIVNRLFLNPIISVVELAKELEVTYPTAKKDIERLVELGILSQISTISLRTYGAPHIFNIAYVD